MLRPLLVAFVILGVLAPAAAADTFTVTTETDDPTATCADRCSLRGAITRANTDTGKDVIIVPAGRYELTVPGSEENGNATGDLDVSDDVDIRGASAQRTIIVGQRGQEAEDRVLDLGPNLNSDVFIPDLGLEVDVEISGLTVRDGAVRTTGQYGGGIRTAATAIISDVAVRDNASEFDAGGIRNDGDLTLERVEISGNQTGGFGGGLTNNLTATLVNVTVTGNRADLVGGGVAVFSPNLAEGDMDPWEWWPARGADTGRDASTIIDSTTIAHNRLGDEPLMTERGLVGDFRGANLSSGDPTGGVPFPPRGDRPPVILVHNTIVSNPGPDANCTTFDIESDGGNLEFPGSSCGFDESSDVRDDPELGELKDNGGPTKTLAIDADSPAYDAGEDEELPGEDQRGRDRPGGVASDIGAFELSDTEDEPVVEETPPASDPVGATEPSTANPLARTCLSRRAFTIRLDRGLSRAIRSTLVSGSATLDGKALEVTRKGGRLTARIDLRNAPKSTAVVVTRVKARSGTVRRATRRFSTCRVSPSGRELPDGRGSTVVPAG